MGFAMYIHAVLALLAGAFPGGSVYGRTVGPNRQRRATYTADNCEGIFSDASHCWPFTNANQTGWLLDKRGDRPAFLRDGAKIVRSAVRGRVVSTMDPYSYGWIDLGDYEGRCIGEPDLCQTGISMIFWAKLGEPMDESSGPSKKYILSSGGSDYRSQGFSFYYESGEFIIKVATRNNVWRAFIPKDEIPSNSWFSFAFTWSEGSGLRYYINGEQSGSGNPSLFMHKNQFSNFRAAKSNSKDSVAAQALRMKFDQLVTWNRILSPYDVQTAFNDEFQIATYSPRQASSAGTASGSVTTTSFPGFSPTTSRREPWERGGGTQEEKNQVDQQGGACEPNPCLHGGQCFVVGQGPEGFKCNCSSGFSGRKCESPEELPIKPLPDYEQFLHHLLAEINLLRRLHQSSDVSASEKLNELANRWAYELAASGEERINPNSTYGQLVCSHVQEGDIAKACAVKWYSAIMFYDWADPKLTMKASSFTQLVWKNNGLAGVGIAREKSGSNADSDTRSSLPNRIYVVVFLDPGQSEDAEIRENVLPAAGVYEPTPDAACPEGYYRLPMGSKSCFSLHTTPRTWGDAVSSCARDGGSLASLETREEADLIVNLLTKENASEAWIGLHDHSSEGRYIWEDGSTIPFSEWLPDEPDGDKEENCIVQARGDHSPGWGDRRCFDAKAFVCEVPLPGFTTYKLTFHITEEQHVSYLNAAYPTESSYPGYYSMCTPYIKSVNGLLRDMIQHFFEVRNVLVMPIVNTIRCMPNGKSNVEVILRLGPGVNSGPILALRNKMRKNDGELELPNGATARLTAIEFVRPGASFCPGHCLNSACQAGCDQHCCRRPIAHFPPSVASVAYQHVSINTGKNIWECPMVCARSISYCPPYCPPRCCKRQFQGKLH